MRLQPPFSIKKDEEAYIEGDENILQYFLDHRVLDHYLP